MKRKNDSHKKYFFTYIISTAATVFASTLFLKGFTPFEKTGENYFQVQLNGQAVGTLADREQAGELLIQARKNVASASSEMVFMETQLDVAGEEVLWGRVDDEKTVLANMEAVLRDSIVETMHRSYTLKVNEYIVNLASVDEVDQLLQAVVDKYDSEDKFRVELVYDDTREFNVLTARVTDTSQGQNGEEETVPEGGIQSFLEWTDQEPEAREEKDFEDYDLGIMEMDFSEDVEIVESYLPLSQLTLLSDAVEQVTKEQEVPSVYTVVSGDTLSAIALKVNIPMEDIVAMNDSLETVETTIRVGQELVITVPVPEISVTRTERNYYEETYDADVIYIDNDSWYTTKSQVLQQPSAGFRKVVADVHYVNDKETSRDLLKEEIVKEAVAKIVERGTKTPPTFIRPISGGRKTSGFGPRHISVKGASTYHQGLDLATPTGTSVYASCGGTVSKAGWGSGYGYVVYIDHEGGSQTRYAHLSKILVKVGQKVKQGERIALSGNTGVTSGPHVHFEILLNGKRVDPEKYIK